MDQLIKNLRALIEKSEGDERKQYEDQLLDAIQKDAEAKAEAKVAEKARENERMEKAKKADASEPVIKAEGAGDKYKGFSIKEVMAKMAESRGEKADYLDRKAEFRAGFFIDKAIQVRTKANELITTTDNVGGYLTPTEQESAILDYMRHTSIALQDANVMPMTSDVMTVPTAGTAPGVTIESAETSITQATPTFGQASLTSKRHSGYIPVSWELLDDNDAGLVAFLADKFYEDLGVTIDSAVFCAPGTVVDQSGVMLNYGASAVMNAASTNFSSVYASVFREAVGKLYPERRQGAKWYIQYDNLWAYVASLADLAGGTEVPLYDRAANKMLGFPVREIRQGIATASSKPIAVLGNLKHFIIGTRLLTTQLKRIPDKTGMDYLVFFTRLAYSNPLTSAFSAVETG